MDIFHEENVVDVSIGKTHATAWTANGDLYVWGLNGHYQCGLQNAQDRRGDPLMDSEEHKEARLQNGSLKGFIATRSQPHTSYVVEPALNRQFKSNDQIKCASCWGQGTAVVLRDGRLLGCGLSSASSVNLPMMEHLEKTGYGGIIHKPNPKLEIFREPRSLRTLGVRMVSCGSNHCLCVTTQTGIMSWGCGSGGKLGHGNNDDVPEPKRIKSMMNDIVLQVACGK
jgi:alpha-tubulin suppressor-like RCC1 family protein